MLPMVRRLTEFLQDLRTAALQDSAQVCDGELLGLFIERQDQDAFAALVQRHAAMVWGVCRRGLAHHHDAEDAFQATFLVLARKAASIRPRDLVANWLHGVAHRTALKARTMTARRKVREKQVPQMPELAAAAPPCWAELEAILDHELAALPENYRAPIILCDLEGKTGRIAARQLNIPQGTLAGRLRAGRKMLARRLARHGLALSAGALATALFQNVASARAPAAMVSRTIQNSLLAAAGKTAAAGMVSNQIAALTKGVLKSMFLAKLKPMIAGMVVLGMAVLGGGILAHNTATGQQAAKDSQGERLTDPATDSQEVPNPRKIPVKAPAPEAPLVTGKERSTNVTYPVADLVVPIEDLDAARYLATKEQWLINKITKTVAPSTWKNAGASGTISYFSPGMALIVNNAPRVQAQVKDLLETMRRVQNVQVCAETRILTLDAASYLKVQALLPRFKQRGECVLSEAETDALLRTTQQFRGIKCSQLPKDTFFPGQKAHIRIDSSGDNGERQRIEFTFDGLISANLQQIEFAMGATIGKTEFSQKSRLEDGATMAQCKRAGGDYLLVLITARVILVVEHSILPPAPANVRKK
jgi:RNA polymerase sigma factor (sigma-70 family)